MIPLNIRLSFILVVHFRHSTNYNFATTYKLIRLLVDCLVSQIIWHVVAELHIVSRMSVGDHQNKELADIKQRVY